MAHDSSSSATETHPGRKDDQKKQRAWPSEASQDVRWSMRALENLEIRKMRSFSSASSSEAEKVKSSEPWQSAMATGNSGMHVVDLPASSKP
jgi:hypothetical protein